MVASILGCVAQPIWVAYQDGLTRVANPSAAAMLGYDDVSGVLGGPACQMIHYEYSSGLIDGTAGRGVVITLQDAGERRMTESVLRKRDAIVSALGQPAYAFTPEGLIRYANVPSVAVLSFSDLTARRAAEQATREHEVAEARATVLTVGQAGHPAILAVALEGVIIIDQQGTTAYVNAANGRILGCHGDQVLGRELVEAIVPLSSREAHGRGLARYPTPGQRHILDRRIKITATRADGSEFPAELPVTRADLPSERAFIGYVRDSAEPERSEEDSRTVRGRLKEISADQAALSRVAALVAAGAPQDEVFAIVAKEVAGCLDLPLVSITRFEAGDTAVHVGGWGREPFPVGTSWRLDEHGAAGLVYHSGCAARADYAHVPGPIAATLAGEAGTRFAVAVPVIVSNRTWGVIMALSTVPQPDSTEARLAIFSELAATAVTHAQARLELSALADEHAALGRVATQVARGERPATVFASVVEEAGRLLAADLASLGRYDADDMVTLVATWSAGDPVPAGLSAPVGQVGAARLVRETGRPVRLDHCEPGMAVTSSFGIRAAVAAPINVAGRLWGFVAVGARSDDTLLPPGTEDRLAAFTELAATAIAHVQAREDLREVADEQAALRQVATLVAHGAEPKDVFDAVCESTGRLIGAASVNLAQFTSNETNLTLAGWSQRGTHVPPGTHLPLEGDSINVVIRQTCAPARVDTYEGRSGQLCARLRELGIRSEVGAPIVVDGRIWGALIAGTDYAEPMPADTERRVARFAELIGAAVSNATARSDLVDSRARMVAAFDAARQRVTRDLHDGAQQQLLSAIMNLQLAQQSWSSAPQEAKGFLDLALRDTRSSIGSLREIAVGIHPAILTHRGLAAAVGALAARLPIPVYLDITDRRLPAPIEASAYFFCSEALTNVVKHAHASSALVRVELEDDGCTVEVRDDGIGGAELGLETSGLIGLRDRIGALKGAMDISSPISSGTTLRAWIPVPRKTGAPLIAGDI